VDLGTESERLYRHTRMLRVLLVDDDLDLAKLLAEYLGKNDAEVVHVATGELGLARAKEGGFDAVLLDVMLPGIDGFEVCRALRAASDVPVVMLTARGDDDARIVGLEIGADDYVPKPFNPRELLARVRAVLRRTKKTEAPARERIEVGELVIDVPAHEAKLGERPVSLTSFEFRLLVALARRAGETIAREDLATQLKGGTYDPAVDRSLDVHVSHLRQKIEKDPKDPKVIRTIRGIGYVLVRPAEAGKA
jgi:DNA-binding response OmpR family regulator